jgi:hypothetical protein
VQIILIEPDISSRSQSDIYPAGDISLPYICIPGRCIPGRRHHRAAQYTYTSDDFIFLHDVISRVED